MQHRTIHHEPLHSPISQLHPLVVVVVVAPLTSIVSSSSSTVPEIGWRGGHWTRKLCRLIFGGGGWEMEMIPICMPSPIGKLHCRPLNEQPASQLGSHYHPNTEQGSPTSGHKYSSWPSVVDGRQTQTGWNNSINRVFVVFLFQSDDGAGAGW